MTKMTIIDAETTAHGPMVDILSDALSSMRISGSILLDEEYAPPWAVTLPGGDRLRSLLKIRGDVRVIAFHFVRRGYIEITPENGDRIILESGEMAICFGGSAHQLAQGTSRTLVPVETLLVGGTNPFRPEPASRLRTTSLLCGAFLMHNVELNPLFAALPPLLHLSASPTREHLSHSAVLDRLTQELNQKSFGSNYIVERLLELLCADALRAYIETAPAHHAGWIRGLRDPAISRALAKIHAQPGTNWSVEGLAAGVAMSASRFAARFTAALGDSPMAYVTKWRMNIACRLLKGTRKGIAEIAADVGYENVTAFNRTFKRHVGLPPAAWRSLGQGALTQTAPPIGVTDSL